MNQNRVISTAVLFLLLGTTIPAFAQKGQGGKGRRRRKRTAGATPAATATAQQHAQRQAQPQRAQQAHASSKHSVPSRCSTSNNRSAYSKRSNPEAAGTARCLQPWQQRLTIMAAFLTTVTVPILVMATRSAWAVPGCTTGITASSTAAIGSDIMNHGHQAGATTTTFMSSTLGAAITCTTGGIPAFTLPSTCSNDLASTPSGEDSIGTGQSPRGWSESRMSLWAGELPKRPIMMAAVIVNWQV